MAEDATQTFEVADIRVTPHTWVRAIGGQGHAPYMAQQVAYIHGSAGGIHTWVRGSRPIHGSADGIHTWVSRWHTRVIVKRWRMQLERWHV